MHKLYTLRIFPILLFLNFINPVNVSAGGFQNNGLSMKAVSMGGAFTGVASDASASFFNPGAMSFLEYSQLAVGTSLRLPSSSYLSPYAGNSEMANNILPSVHFYGVLKLNENLAVGISFNSPFNLHTKWNDNWTGRYLVKEAIRKAYYIQPALSYKINESLSVGGGPIFAVGKTFLSKSLLVSSALGELGMELDGKSSGFGFNLGAFYKVNEKFNAGLNYRSAVKMKTKKGDAVFSNVPSSLVNSFPASTSFETTYTLPSVISAGISWNILKDLMLCADINYTTWKSFDSLEYKFNTNSSLNFGSGKFYKNAFALRVGAQYTLNTTFTVRGGVSLDKSPVRSEYLSPEEPDADRYIFSLGGSVKLGTNFSVDVAYMLQNIKEREAINKEVNFGGVYKNLINIFGVTLNYHF